MPCHQCPGVAFPSGPSFLRYHVEEISRIKFFGHSLAKMVDPERYTFDAAGNIVKVEKQTAGNWQDSVLYAYDPADHNLLRTMTHGGLTTEFTFDSGKRWRTSQGPDGNENLITYAYTGTGRLASYAKEADAGAPAVSGTYSYDASGQRKASTVTVGTGETQTQTTTLFTYTGLTLHKLEATKIQGDASESWSLTYLYDEYGKAYAGIYRDTTSAQNPPAPVLFAMVTTDRGDVVELLDASGQAFAAYRYDAWGNPLDVGNAGRGTWAQGTVDNENHEVISPEVATKIAQRQPLRYAGYCYDSESGLYYLSARHYDPATRQFLSKDLSRNDGEQSAYQYCLGNPVGFTDPTGLTPEKTENIWEVFMAEDSLPQSDASPYPSLTLTLSSETLLPSTTDS